MGGLFFSKKGASLRNGGGVTPRFFRVSLITTLFFWWCVRLSGLSRLLLWVRVTRLLQLHTFEIREMCQGLPNTLALCGGPYWDLVHTYAHTSRGRIEGCHQLSGFSKRGARAAVK